jgi:hypothetical protein
VTAPGARGVRLLPALAASLAALALTPTCDGQSTHEGASPSLPGAVVSTAKWRLAWDLDGVTLSGDGAASFATNQGYDVALQAGWMVTHSVSFGACEPATSTQAAGLGAWLGVRPAHAHTEDTHPSWIEVMRAEPLSSPVSAEAAASSFAPSRVCRVHWLVARTDHDWAGPGGSDLAGKSVRLAGTWSKAGREGSFGIDTWWPHGRLVELADAMDEHAYAEARARDGTHAAFVTLTRTLATSLDDVDLATASDDVVTGRFLANMADGARVEVKLVPL